MKNVIKNQALLKKKENLDLFLNKFRSLAVAFSGGVDSTFLLAAAQAVLQDRILAVTAASPVHPEHETEAAREFAKKIGVHHVVINIPVLDNQEFLKNSKQRCYICKKIILGEFIQIAADHDIKNLVHGTNLDDLNDFRPGNAAAEEQGVLSPLVEAGMTKGDIRALSRSMDLPTWNMPAMACLATRIPYGTPITDKALRMVEKSENVIHELGFTNCRVRHHGSTARIEVEKDRIEKILDKSTFNKISNKLNIIGFKTILIDKNGYIPSGLKV